MALTLIEASKGEANIFTRGVIETFVQNQRIAQVVPIRNITGSLDGVVQEAQLPGAATRGVNEAFTPSEGKLAEIIQSLKIYGGDIGVDPFIIATKGPVQAARHVSLKIKAIANRWVLDFFKGDAATNPRDFDGLQSRLSGFNVVPCGTAALQLSAHLDEAIMRCWNPQFLAMGRRTAQLLTNAARSGGATTPVVGFLVYERNEFGSIVMRYNGLEVIIVTDAANNDNVLDFTEATSTSSIYVFGVGAEGVEGIQNGGFRVRNLGEDNTTPREDTRVEWYNNFQINHPRSVIRVSAFTNVAFTA